MTQIPDNQTPVLILRSVAHGPLGVLRSLGRLGVPVYVADSDPWTPASASRFCRGKFVYHLENVPSDQALGNLLQIGRILGSKAILIPTTDEAAIFVADHSNVLKDRFLFHCQAPGLVRTLCSKRAMASLAAQCGVPVPATVYPESKAEVKTFLETTAFPVVAKGIDGLKFLKQTGKRVFLLNTPQEVLDKWEQAGGPGEPNLLLQEYIPGADDTIWMFNGYFDRHSNCLVGFTGKKIRQCPIHRGVTSFGVCLSNKEVENTTKAFMKAIGYRGILDIGYRYDARDGRYKVLDINPRLGATFRLFVSDTGMDVVRALYLDLTNKQFMPGDPLYGRKWLVEDLDAVSSIRYFLEGTLQLSRWARSYRGVRELAYFVPDDLWPLFPMLMHDSQEFTRRVGRKIAALSAPIRKLRRPRSARPEPMSIHDGKNALSSAD